MAISDKDPYNARETARIILLGVRAVRREARGKSIRGIEKQAARIREEAQAREDARAAARRKARGKR
ncbi:MULTISPECIES: hypothetical protein [unclassified Streptomyces]|uniref:hypothetical protein n=1 Tax=unclassified Streptomyces TaxID=2593676 RepID=UPI000E3075BB|nr:MULTISPECIES: hypothetical protein [unclassified Streptomyces]RFC72304.1 hypothetical protein DXZ75_35760 [Streptomyces sp. AcE210]WSE05150.1 hypothetical protein OG574_18380 [Streptomyces sp. NBC_01445]